MKVVEIDPANRKQTRQFLDFPFQLYANTTQWVPPLETDALRVFDRKHFPFYQCGEAIFLMAYKGEQPKGRLAFLNNHSWNEYNQARTAFFYLFECADDQEAAGALFAAGFSWARERGLDCVIGPKGFTVFDGMGMLVKGFEHRPAFGLPYNLPYFPKLVEALGCPVAISRKNTCSCRFTQDTPWVYCDALQNTQRTARNCFLSKRPL